MAALALLLSFSFSGEPSNKAVCGCSTQEKISATQGFTHPKFIFSQTTSAFSLLPGDLFCFVFFFFLHPKMTSIREYCIFRPCDSSIPSMHACIFF
jgi:hypothetical protein